MRTPCLPGGCGLSARLVGVTGAIVRTRRRDQLDGWLPAATLELTAKDPRQIVDVVEPTGAGSGPGMPNLIGAV